VDAGRAMLALMIGVTGAILVIAGVKDVHPAIVFQQLLATGTLPSTGAKKAETRPGVRPVVKPPSGGGGSIPTKI
jgi:hypothetical protein